MGNCESIRRPKTSRELKIERIFRALDTDGSKVISVDELVEWVLDERFIENEFFVDIPVTEIARELMVLLDTDGSRDVSIEELGAYFDTLPEETIEAMCSTLLLPEELLKDKGIRRLNKILNKNSDNVVSKKELLTWLKSEPAWKTLSALMKEEEKVMYMGDNDQHRSSENGLQYNVYQEIDADADEEITLDELKRFFREWSLRELREFSEDLNFKYELAKLTKEVPDAEHKKRELERERKYMQKLEQRRMEKFKEKRALLLKKIENAENNAAPMPTTVTVTVTESAASSAPSPAASASSAAS